MLSESNAHGSYFRGTSQAHKLGSLSYSHVNNFSTVDTAKGPTIGGPSNLNQTNTQAEDLEAGHGGMNDSDDFMTLPPAEVQDSWRVQPMIGTTKDETEKVSGNKAHVGDSKEPGCIVEDPKATESSNRSPVHSDLSRRLFHTTNQSNGIDVHNRDMIEEMRNVQRAEDGNTDAVETAKTSMNQNKTDEPTTQQEEQTTDEKTDRMLFDMSNVGIIEEDEITPLDESQTERAKATLESDMLEEADKLFRSHRARGDVNGGRMRPLSMPAMDAPLSDTEF